MKLLVVSALVLAVAAGWAQAASTPPSQSGPIVDAGDVGRYLQVARGYESCVLRCEDRYRACMSAAETEDAQRSCRLDRNLCESDCSRFGTR